jgi:diguanylate cyclase (GGDEF)-like protein
MFARHNYTVLLANCGSDALTVLDNNSDIKLIIIDKEMPNMDGLELCNVICVCYTKDEISIIGVFGVDNTYLTAKFIKNGANDFLKKPFCPEEFYCRVLQNIEYIENIETIKRQANTDYLTELFNRRYFFETLTPIVKSLVPQTLAMMDIDHFKSVNDNYGHDIGDEVLKIVANLLKEHFPAPCVVARLGGEEFSVFFGEEPINAAIERLEAFRIELSKIAIQANDESLQCTMSIGVTNQIQERRVGLINFAYGLLYQPK